MVRAVVIAIALMVALAAVPSLASAQGPNVRRNPNIRVKVNPNAVKKPAASNTNKTNKTNKTKTSDKKAKKPEKTSKAMALVFWLFALMCIGGSVFVITRRNLIAAVMGMVGTFFAIAAVYAMLYAHFLAAIQVLVYAGAIMVLFVFVIMILNRPVDEPWSKQGVVGKGVAAAGTLYLLYRLADVLWAIDAQVVGKGPGEYIDKADFGSTAAVGKVLFLDYIFPFEAVSIVLLVAVVGAIAVARPHEKRETAAPDAETQGGAA